MPDKIIEIFVFIFGLVTGSFLNVCIWRLPQEESIVKPWSYCPHCKNSLLWYDNIPILSFVILKGKCRFCQAKISLRYPLVELITASILLLLFRHFGLSRDFFIYAALTCGLIVISFIDIEHRIIPNEISIGGIIVGLIFALLKSIHYPLSIIHYPIFDSLLGVIIGGGIIFLTGVVGNITLKKESMGGGDVKLLAMIGSFLGWKKTVLTFFIAPLFGLIPGIILKIKKQDLIPYGPFLSLAAIVSILWGEKIFGWLF